MPVGDVPNGRIADSDSGTVAEFLAESAGALLPALAATISGHGG